MRDEKRRKAILAGWCLAMTAGLAGLFCAACAAGYVAFSILLFLLLAVFVAGAAAFYMGWFRPVHRTLAVVKEMADGCFGSTAPDTDLGEAVNQVSVNTQEAFLLVWNHGADAARAAEKARASANGAAEALEALEGVEKALSGIREVITSFGFYGVRLGDSEGACHDPGPGVFSEHE